MNFFFDCEILDQKGWHYNIYFILKMDETHVESGSVILL